MSGERLRSKTMSAAIALIVLIAAQSIAIGPVRHWMLEHEVRVSTGSWATHIFEQIETAASDATSDMVRLEDAGHLNLAAALEAALRAGVIHRATILDRTCGCHIVIDGALLGGNRNSVAEALWQFFQGVGDPVDMAPSALTFDDPTGATSDTGALSPRVIFLEQNEPGYPRNTAEVTFQRRIDAKDYALSLLVDITGAAANLQLMLIMAATIVSAILIGAGVVVARIASKSNRAVTLSEKQARFLAEHDTMTGLLNRFGFGTRAEALLRERAAKGGRAFLFQVDADKFKEINDIYGHATGDRVIHAIGEMLKSAFPDAALVARLGGDEFAVLVSETALNASVEQVLHELPTGTDITADDGRKLIEVSTSIGLAVFPDDAETLGDLMKAADLALYDVKAAGRNGVGAYRRDMTKALERRHWELDGVREAIREGRLLPYYQPLISARTGRVMAVEALARWNHPVYGVLSPSRFGHALEDPRVSTEITQEILARVADDLRVWKTIGHDFKVTLNIGEADLRDPDLIENLSATLADRGLTPGSLSIEVTETALTRVNSAAARPLLQRYRDIGGAVALDDFGTGNSSITLLKDMPCSTVKIDRSFIKDLTENAADLAIVRSIVRLSRELGFQIVAEGIETREQAQLLRKLRVDLLQGFLYSRPLPARELTAMLEWASPPRRPGPDPVDVPLGHRAA